MHSNVIKKFNEIIGMIKLIERELAGYGVFEERKRIAAQRYPDVMAKFEELNEVIVKNGSDELTNKYYKELRNEISRILDLKEPVKEKKF